MYYDNNYSSFGNGFNMGNNFDNYSNLNSFNSIGNYDIYSNMRNIGDVGNSFNNGNMFSSGNSFNLGNTSKNIGKIGLFSRLNKGINWNDLLNNTSRTLNIVNQAIPIVNQAKPLINNMKTMLRIATIMKEDNNVNTFNNKNGITSKKVKVEKNDNYQSDNQPTFFL